MTKPHLRSRNDSCAAPSPRATNPASTHSSVIPPGTEAGYLRYVRAANSATAPRAFHSLHPSTSHPLTQHSCKNQASRRITTRLSSTRTGTSTQERSRPRTTSQALPQCRRGVQQQQQSRRTTTDAQDADRPEKTGAASAGRAHEDAPSRGAGRPERQTGFRRR